MSVVPTTGPSNPLEVTELVLAIFHMLSDSPKALRNVVLVNREWFELGTEVLWAKCPPEDLASLPRERRQLYATKVTTLKLHTGLQSFEHHLFRGIDFPRLRHVCFDGSYSPAVAQIDQYIQRSLETVTFVEHALMPRIMARIMRTCHRVQDLQVTSSHEAFGESVTPDRLRWFLILSPSIKRMRFAWGADRVFSEAVWLHLARRSNLLEFETDAMMTRRLLMKIRQSIPHPFPKLVSLETSLPPNAAGKLAGAAPRIQALTIILSENVKFRTPPPRLDGLSDLCELTVIFPRDVDSVAWEVVEFGGLSNLRELHLGPAEKNGDQSSRFTDADLRRLLTDLPSLRVFEFGSHGYLRDALEVAGEASNGNLEILLLSGSYNLWPFSLRDGVNNPLFPKLTHLTIGGFIPPPQQVGSDLFRILQRFRFHTPVLRSFTISDQNERRNHLMQSIWDFSFDSFQ